MAGKEDVKDGAGSGLDMLRSEVGDYLGAQAENLVGKTGEKLTGLTQKLLDTASGDGGDGGGFIKGVGSRILQGESPFKALVAEKAGDVKDKVVDKAKGLFGGGSKGKSGSAKVMNIIEVLDIGLPLRTTYDHWTQYDEFSGFTKGVQSVSQSDEVTSDWKLKVGPSKRSYKATVQEQIPDQRIVWTSEGAKGTTRGCVTFHELAPELTRIVLVVEYSPAGFFEKTGNIWRAQGRRLRLDFKNFQRYVSFADPEELEGWRGEIRDGEVVRSHEEAVEEEENEAAEDEEGEGDEEEYEDEEEDEYDDEAPDEDGDFEDEEEEEDEEDEEER
ncbi:MULTISPECIES: SRPBCC family protein [unclassified Streptomyces]|uniref:SRPBCC family protein n=1 Tax=unclassified Streptomyces TaxID=2593676 RepID=UPI002E28D7EE|nr:MULTISPECIES: SRPBCC family protein [unclassified Streptomyces]WUB85714.1 SRPBCC family protein [Streptomyces sp. NBC_00566]